MIRTTVEIVYDYNPETKETILVSQKIIGETPVSEVKTKTTKATKAKSTIEDKDNPGVIREDGKLILSQATIELLGVEPDDRVYIGYDKFGSKFKPFIGTDEKKGNKLTKSNTVSYRGKSNEELAFYGSQFTLSPGKHNGTFYLEGDVAIDYSEPEGISVNEEDVSDDIPFDLNLDDTNAKKITTFTFTDIDLD